MKHVVFVVGNYKNGGVPMRSTNLANAFAEKGYSATILITKDIADNIYFSLHENVSLVVLSDYIKSHKEQATRIAKEREKSIKRIKKLRYFTKFNKNADNKLALKIKEVRKGTDIAVFAENNPDSVFITFGLGYYESTYYSVKKYGCDVIYAERNAPEVEFPSDESFKEYYISLVDKAAGAVLQTMDELKFYNERLKNPIVINNPVKANLPEPFDGERRKTVVNFCRIALQKNIPLMIDAFLKLHKEFSEYTLEIYGNTVAENEEQLLEEYKEFVRKHNADGYIKFLPPRADVHEVIKDAMMFVSSSDFEGLSNSMLEAMAIGLPCVCTDCLGGGAREMITDGENGLLVPMNDADSLYKAMKRMIVDEELRTKCSSNASKVRESHAVERISEKWLDYIESII